MATAEVDPVLKLFQYRKRQVPLQLALEFNKTETGLKMFQYRKR